MWCQWTEILAKEGAFSVMCSILFTACHYAISAILSGLSGCHATLPLKGSVA